MHGLLGPIAVWKFLKIFTVNFVKEIIFVVYPCTQKYYSDESIAIFLLAYSYIFLPLLACWSTATK